MASYLGIFQISLLLILVDILFDNSVNSILEEHRQTLALNILWKSVSVNVFQVKIAKQAQLGVPHSRIKVELGFIL